MRRGTAPPRAAARIAWACRVTTGSVCEEAQFRTGILAAGEAAACGRIAEEPRRPAGGCDSLTLAVASPPRLAGSGLDRSREASCPTFQSAGASNYDTPSSRVSDSAVAVLDA
jgi:hypothetical protein